jgi:hypothetical protein
MSTLLRSTRPDDQPEVRQVGPLELQHTSFMTAMVAPLRFPQRPCHAGIGSQKSVPDANCLPTQQEKRKVLARLALEEHATLTD